MKVFIQTAGLGGPWGTPRHTVYNPLTSIGNNSSQENSPRNSPDFATWPARLSWPACSKHTAACMHRFFHIFGRPGEPAVWLYVRVGSGRFLAGEDICGATDHFQRFWSGCGRKRVKRYSSNGYRILYAGGRFVGRGQTTIAYIEGHFSIISEVLCLAPYLKVDAEIIAGKQSGNLRHLVTIAI